MHSVEQLPAPEDLDRICDSWVFQAVQRYCETRDELLHCPIGRLTHHHHLEYEEDPDLRPYLWDL